jgi:hypothetical protein
MLELSARSLLLYQKSVRQPSSGSRLLFAFNESDELVNNCFRCLLNTQQHCSFGSMRSATVTSSSTSTSMNTNAS